MRMENLYTEVDLYLYIRDHVAEQISDWCTKDPEEDDNDHCD